MSEPKPKPTEEQIRKRWYEAVEYAADLFYEEGVRDALGWVLGERQEEP